MTDFNVAHYVRYIKKQQKTPIIGVFCCFF